MSSIVRSILGATLLLTGASAAMAQSANPPVASQPVQTGASTAAVASNNAPVVYQSAQAGVTTATAAPVVDQKPRSNVSDNTDPYGGHDPKSLAGSRAFWEALNPY